MGAATSTGVFTRDTAECMFTQSWQGGRNNEQARDMNGCRIYEQAKGEVARQGVQGCELRAANGATAEGEEECESMVCRW